MHHPSDSPSWKLVDHRWPDFASEPRNLRLAISADVINPHSSMSSRHSCWPIIMVIYNLPPWLCMKRKFMMLSLLISGPRQPGNDIDVYLAPLLDDLKMLWDVGVECYDVHQQKVFTLRVALLWTINDFPAYGNLSGCVVKGYFACPICGEDTFSHRLKHGKKNSYTGEVRLCGPVYLRWMYPFERFMKVLERIEAAIGNNEPISETIKWIAHGPSHYVSKYHGYVINGCRYHTKERDDLRATQNSGVSIVASTMQIASAKDQNPVFGALLQIEAFDGMDDSDATCHGMGCNNHKNRPTGAPQRPPIQYTFIEDEDWTIFVKDRLPENFKCSGSNDILVEALGTPEYNGRVRAKRKYYTPRQDFNSAADRAVRDFIAASKEEQRIFQAEVLAKLSQASKESKETKKHTPVNFPDDVFGESFKTFMMKEDMEMIISSKEVSSNCILYYIWHLHRKLIDAKQAERYVFVNPALVSKGLEWDREARKTVALEMKKMIAYYLDPMACQPCDDLKDIVNMAMRINPPEKQNIKEGANLGESGLPKTTR
ncbi:hypothetical protein CK203_091040 [Vitis vinifera]|uniref:Transposase n=1 Tax=Vitis vinifera TaxID=29760 RepID=A0A438BV08_VITVI|nr:hypothetical protein CK203_091040 [Vitis vinifera]